MQGQLLHFKDAGQVQTDVARLDLTGYKPGMYLVRVKAGGVPDAVQKLVVQ